MVRLCWSFGTERLEVNLQDRQDRKRQDIQDSLIILNILPLAILSILFFLVVGKVNLSFLGVLSL